MADKAMPMTAAERQRAYRKRHKNDGSVQMPRMDPGEMEQLLEDDGSEVSIVELNAHVRRMALRTLKEIGDSEWLKRVARKSPNTFLRFVGQFVTREDTINPGAYTFIIQQVNLAAAQPVRGVIASPVAGHIGGARLIGAPGEVIEEERDD